MKIGKYRDTESLHLLLETLEDLNIYYKIYSEVTSKKNIQSLFGFKSQKFKTDFSDYLAHEGSTVAPETRLLALQLSFKETPTSMIDICSMSDKIMIDKFNAIDRYISRGDIVRLNTNGGMCNIDDLTDYPDIIDIIDDNIKLLTSFIVNKTLIDEEIIIKNKDIIIENSRDVDPSFIKKLSDIGIISPQIINNFKSRTILWKDKDYYITLVTGIKQGLQNICIETTGQDLRSINKLVMLFEKIFMDFPTVKLNLYLKTYDNKVKTLFKTNSNLTIQYI